MPRYLEQRLVARRSIKFLSRSTLYFVVYHRPDRPFLLKEDRYGDRIGGGQGCRPELQTMTPCPKGASLFMSLPRSGAKLLEGSLCQYQWRGSAEGTADGRADVGAPLRKGELIWSDWQAAMDQFSADHGVRAGR